MHQRMSYPNFLSLVLIWGGLWSFLVNKEKVCLHSVLFTNVCVRPDKHVECISLVIKKAKFSNILNHSLF